MKRKKLFLGILLAIIIGVVTGFVFVGKHSHNVNSSKTNATIRIGSKDFTENLVVAEIYALALEDNGYKVQRVSNISSSLIHRSLEIRISVPSFSFNSCEVVFTGIAVPEERCRIAFDEPG